MDILARIEELRKSKGWSSYKLAVESDLSQSTLANMYARGTLPSLTTLINICDAFGISMADFFTDASADLSDGNQENSKEKSLTKEICNEFIKLDANDKELVIAICKSLNKKQ